MSGPVVPPSPGIGLPAVSFRQFLSSAVEPVAWYGIKLFPTHSVSELEGEKTSSICICLMKYIHVLYESGNSWEMYMAQDYITLTRASLRDGESGSSREVNVITFARWASSDVNLLSSARSEVMLTA